MKTHKGGFTDQQNRERDANKAGKELRETAEAMLIAAKGDINDVKNLTEEQIKVALKKKAEMEEKIMLVMNDPALKEKITESVNNLSETLNELTNKAKATAEKSLEEAKAKAEELNQKRIEAGLTGEAAQEKISEGMNAASEAAKDLDARRRAAGLTGEAAQEKMNEGLNFARGLLNMTTKMSKGKKGGKRKNKTKKLTKKEKKMKKARK